MRKAVADRPTSNRVRRASSSAPVIGDSVRHVGVRFDKGGPTTMIEIHRGNVPIGELALGREDAVRLALTVLAVEGVCGHLNEEERQHIARLAML